MPGVAVTQMEVDQPKKPATSTELKRDLFLVSSEDTIYEQDILRNPGSIRPWLTYIDHKLRNGTIHEQAFVQERACIALPRSYKLWKRYLDFRVKHLRSKNPVIHKAEFNKVNALFERAVILLNKMPVIWQMYLSFLLRQPLVTRSRKTFDRALRALPLTQHNRIWRLYKLFANTVGGDTAVKIWSRYIQIHPEDLEDFIELLVDTGNYVDAVKRYIELLNNTRFKSKNVKSHFQLWSEMVDLMVSRAREIGDSHASGLDANAIIRSGIHRFPDQRGKLWTGLATYWISRGDFERARAVFEEGITTVMTVRDFSMVFDSYVEFEESIISNLMQAASSRANKGATDHEADFDLDLRMMRFEHLMDRRPFLVNDVLLRQNPNNVIEWEKRVALWNDNKAEVVQTYTDAIAAIQPKKAVGKFYELWLSYAKLYEEGGDLATARVILDKAVKVPYKSVAELAETWIGWAEMELRNEDFDKAMEIMATATRAPKRSTVDYFDETLSPQQRIHKSWKVWSFYVDLVESVGSIADTRAIYDRIFELRIATPQTVVNYANLLEEHHYYEDSFKIYERGLDLFSYPVAFELWNLYLTKAVDRHISMERLRDLFEQAVENVPPEFARTIYLMYGNLEEERGLARHAMRIYERATRAVSDEDRSSMFNFYITKSASNFGLTSTRPIYERAIAALPDQEAKEMCLKFAEMERRLGEIDRARAIYGHASQFADPRIAKDFWETWEKFEVGHGNEDTFKEMLRVKRSVASQYNTDVNFIASQAITRAQQQQQQQQQQNSHSTIDNNNNNSTNNIPPLMNPAASPTNNNNNDAMTTLEKQTIKSHQNNNNNPLPPLLQQQQEARTAPPTTIGFVPATHSAIPASTTESNNNDDDDNDGEKNGIVVPPPPPPPPPPLAGGEDGKEQQQQQQQKTKPSVANANASRNPDVIEVDVDLEEDDE